MLSSKIVLTIIKNMKKYLQNLMVKKKKITEKNGRNKNPFF